MEIIKIIDSTKYLVKCNDCGHTREVNARNFDNGFGNLCSLSTCGVDYIILLFKKNNYDYSFIRLTKDGIEVKCNICGTVKTTTVSKIKKGIGLYHNGSSCYNYKTEIIGSVINDFTVLSVNNHDKYFGVKMVTIKCNICNRIRVVRDLNLSSYNHSKCVELIEIPKRFYNIWCSIKNRCKHNSYYMGKDCSEFEHFIDFYDSQYNKYINESKTYGEKLISIDRVNNEIGYNSDNIRWVTKNIQLGNTRRNNIIYSISPDERMYKFSNIVVFCKLLNLKRGSVNNSICSSGFYKGWIFVRTSIYDNSENGVETNCVYELINNIWVKLPMSELITNK